MAMSGHSGAGSGGDSWGGMAGPGQPGPVLPPQPEAGQLGGTGATPASGISLGWRPGQAVGPWVGLAWWDPWLSRGSWGPALLWHEWDRDQWSCGSQVGSWAVGRLGGAPGLGRDRQGWRCPWGSDFWSQPFSFCSSSTDPLEQVAYFLSWLHDPRPEERFIAKKVIYLAIPTVRPEYLLRFCVGWLPFICFTDNHETFNFGLLHSLSIPFWNQQWPGSMYATC